RWAVPALHVLLHMLRFMIHGKTAAQNFRILRAGCWNLSAPPDSQELGLAGSVAPQGNLLGVGNANAKDTSFNIVDRSRSSSRRRWTCAGAKQWQRRRSGRRFGQFSR